MEEMIFGDLPEEWIDTLYEIMEENHSSEPFFQPFTPLFSKETLQQSLPRSEPEFIDGIYTFKVSFTNEIWRDVVLSGIHTMDDLHSIILEAFNFDDDHLYSFYMDGKKWSNDCITSPNDSFGHPNAAEVEIGEIGLKPKQQFLYLFDYGDEWTFSVELDHIEEMDSTPIEPYVKAKNGEAPLQYEYDEDYEDDEDY
ncbi:plasmid pRiA4b ORF-3 family protein [Bacillus sp. MM2020_1]|nr:plasmid pRiA4b ORF-3 family protein [Bacillus sp. MM2020_1]